MSYCCYIFGEHRLAFESKPVSKSIHQWIDLVWGYKQSGQEAVDALNADFDLGPGWRELVKLNQVEYESI